MSKDPYQSITVNPYYAKTDIVGRVVAVLDLETKDRGLVLMPTRSRVLRAGDIHELIFTDRQDVGPGKAAPDAIYLAFVEIVSGGVMVTGDIALWSGKALGRVCGFDETHAPNHYNVVISAESPKTGRQLGVSLGDSIVFKAG